MLTNQKIFDKVARHLLKQRAKSLNESGYCVYRGEGGRRCAAGALIPDRCYRPEFDDVATDYSIANLVDLHGPKAVFGTTLEEGGLRLIQALQATHDECGCENWPERLRQDAKGHGLSDAVIDDFPNWMPLPEPE